MIFRWGLYVREKIVKRNFFRINRVSYAAEATRWFNITRFQVTGLLRAVVVIVAKHFEGSGCDNYTWDSCLS